ncbi:hypothetical protein CHS0354_007030 [Potamilus streckersoni]|uniref:thiopurine S-methyltransferase n=1 Tax=Potamilus streckersoni TaxID=2493646 RepID=A0AAE0VLE1_9BIVA|nr:hypothetical protein CHS0354_007030 [Potamilus streckersoni]
MSENISIELNISKGYKRRINQFGDYRDVTNMSVDDWNERWNLEQINVFHMPCVNPMLVKHSEKLLAGKERQRIFIPLCGKSLDLKWLLDKGHTVIGNECSDLGCRQFFQEQGIPYTAEPLPIEDGLKYKATDGSRIELFRCDFFQLNKSMLGEFDCIWDRGSFVAIPVKDRQRYGQLICQVMKPTCRYLLDTFRVDNSVYGGPPFDCPESDVVKSFGHRCKFQLIDTRDAYGKVQREQWGVKSFTEEVYLMQLR